MQKKRHYFMQSWPLEKKNCKLRFILDLKESWLN